MKEKLRRHIESFFEEVPLTKRTIELREELYTNSVERYQDLVAGGASDEDAYKTVISSIGNIQDLIDSIATEEQNDNLNSEIYKKYSLLKAIAAGLYVFAFVVFFGVIYATGEGLLAIIVAGAVCIVPIIINVYTSYMLPKFKKPSGNVVEEFREWQTGKDSNKELKGAISALIWLLTLIVYFAISFGTGAWYITWIVFLVAVCIQIISDLVISSVKNK